MYAGKKRRLTLLECGNDLNTMLDAAKVADLVLLLIDASFGFEMETFEFLNILQVLLPSSSLTHPYSHSHTFCCRFMGFPR